MLLQPTCVSQFRLPLTKHYQLNDLSNRNLFVIILEAEKFQDPGASIAAFILRSLVLAFRQSPSHCVLICPFCALIGT